VTLADTATAENEHAVSHPTPKTYWLIALVLAVITAVEIAIPYIDALDPIKVPALLILGAMKFLIVVAFFMHLRYERNLYRSLFFIGVIGAILLFIVVLLTFRAL
jgi:cytochrome c oxidase subunit 4